MNRRGGDDRVTVGSLVRRDAQHGRGRGRPLAVAVSLARRDSRSRRGIIRHRRGRHSRPRRGNPLHHGIVKLVSI